MNKIKSKQVIRRFAFQEWGGTETVVWNTSKSLAQSGCDTEILATKALANKAQEIVEDISIKRFSYFYPYLNLGKDAFAVLDKKGGNPYSLPLYQYLLKEKDIDILHCHTMQRIANTVRLAARKKKIPYVISFHGGFFEVPQSEIDEMIKPLQGTFNYGKIFDILFKNNLYLDDVDGIICVGHNEYLATREKYPNKVVEYLPNGVDIDKFKVEVDPEFRFRYNIDPDADLILCVSRIDYQKNQLKLIELVNELRNKNYQAHVMLIGPITSEAYHQKIVERIEELKLNDLVTIIPGLQASDPELVQAYKNADYFILPSIHEPFGIVTLEAWASNLPTIVHKVGGLQKLVTDEQTGLFFQNDSIEDLTKKFIKLKTEDSLRSKIIDKSYREVCEKYSWSTITEKLVEIYRKVIAKTGGN